MSTSNHEFTEEATPTFTKKIVNLFMALILIVAVPYLTISAVLIVLFAPETAILIALIICSISWAIRIWSNVAEWAIRIRSDVAEMREELCRYKTEAARKVQMEKQESNEVAEPNEDFLQNVRIPKPEWWKSN